MMAPVLLILCAYLLGSVPFGLMVGKSHGVDPRLAGSGNIGATNVGRLLGRRFFVMVFLLDMLKGLLPMLAAAYLLRDRPEGQTKYLLWLLVGLAAILGHMFSIFLKFDGGKGVATSCGVILGLYPYFTYAGIIALLIWLIIFKTSRYVGLASVVAAASFPLAYMLLGLAMGWPVFREQLPLLLFGILVAAMIALKHRSNLARLRAGTEPRFDDPATPIDEAGPG